MSIRLQILVADQDTPADFIPGRQPSDYPHVGSRVSVDVESGLGYVGTVTSLVFSQKRTPADLALIDGNPKAANARRVAQARDLLDFYKRSYEGRAEPIEDVIVDLLADLMHWGSRRRRHGTFDKFEVALARARDHFEAEEQDAGIVAPRPATSKAKAKKATYGRFKFEPVVANEPRTWIAAVWNALDCINWGSEEVEGYLDTAKLPDDLEDEVKTAMAWLEEHFGLRA